MRNDRGTADLMLLAAILAGTVIGAKLATSAWDALDTAAGHVTIYAAAVVAGITLWRRGVQPVRRGLEVLFGLDNRLARVEKRQIRIEQHLGLEPLPEDTGA